MSCYVMSCYVMSCYVMLGKDALLPIHTEDDNGKSDTEAEEEEDDDDEVIIVPRPGEPPSFTQRTLSLSYHW